MEIQLELEKLISYYFNRHAYHQSLPYEELRRRAIQSLEADLKKLKGKQK